ncbi:hypothetical protein BH09MYX1_BH09MYX1_49160 [soil metagenome]
MRKLVVLAIATFTATLVLHGCSSAEPPAPIDPYAGVVAGCDPLVPEHCGFPFPNDLWRTTVGGQPHLDLAPMLPVPFSAAAIDPGLFSNHDGFSPGEEALAFFPHLASTGLSDEDHIDATLSPSSATILLDAETGALVPHFAEIDAATFHEDDRALMIRPVVRLKDAHRYIVAVHGLVDVDGKAIAPSPAFRALRDSMATTSATFETRRAHFDDVFAKLAAVGVPRGELQLAWDYTTASRDNTTADLVWMRDDALTFVGDDGPEYTITSVEPSPNADLAARLRGNMKVPLYLDKPDPGGVIVRDEAGKPKRNGTAEYPFVILVPKSATPDAPAAILQNGHGLLGSRNEGINDYFAAICNTNDFVGIAVDWVGMAHDDVDTITQATTQNLNLFRNAVDRQHQGIVNSLLAMRMMMGRMKNDPNLLVNGKSILDPSKRYYRGDSQGGIFGATYMALSTDVTRGLLGEPGMPYTLLLDRSADFSGFRFLLKGGFPNGLDVRLVEAFLQIMWDRTEPDGYAPYIAKDMLPNTPEHRILIHAAIGDHQVTPLGAHVLARTVGAKNLQPVNRNVFGIPGADGPLDGESVLVEYEFGLPPAPKANLPMKEGQDPHDTVRELPASIAQSNEFFRTGRVKPYCDGPCNPQ